MIVLLHIDDDYSWLQNLADKKIELGGILGDEVTILSRLSVGEARAVVKGDEPIMRELIGRGHRLNIVVVDLMMEGGTRDDIRKWIESVLGMKDKILAGETTGMFDDIDRACPGVRVGRDAAASGAKVVVLTNATGLIKKEKIELRLERALILRACGAATFILKDEHWFERLVKALKTEE